MKDSLALMQEAVSIPVKKVMAIVTDAGKIFNLYGENKALKGALNQFAQLEAEYELLKKENERLRQMLNLPTTLKAYRLAAAEVIARQHDTWYNVLTVNKGEKDGIKPDMAVITPQGLVGMVENVSYFTSNVRLISDIERTRHISVLSVGKSETFGIIESYDAERKELIMRKIPLESNLLVGDSIVTSGLGGVFPKGLLIGKVTEILPGEDGLTKMAYVKPAADLYQLDEVFLVMREDQLKEGGGNP
ncbi:Cell shape-determining protein MreC [[Clostridium] ultunense Esp]|nr:Cell shape-determining protein MreC [[Clostridium] ultunense Esp]